MRLTINTVFTSDDVLSRAESVCSWSFVCMSSMKASKRPVKVTVREVTFVLSNLDTTDSSDATYSSSDVLLLLRSCSYS